MPEPMERPGWTPLRIIRWAGWGTAVLLVCAVILTAKQLHDPPIAIEPFKITTGSDTSSFAPESLAANIKSEIGKIYSAAGDLFETRKLGDSTIPLDVSIGHDGLHFNTLLSVYLQITGSSLTAADITGRLYEENKQLFLEWTTNKPEGVMFESVPVLVPGTLPAKPVPGDPGAAEPPFDSLDQAITCVALKIVADISPDVAANYLHVSEEGGAVDSAVGKRHCLTEDDVALYSRVSSNEDLPAASRINSWVGLSVHYSHAGQFFEELEMAKDAAEFSLKNLPCEDTSRRSAWQRVKCKWPFLQHDLNKQAAVAASMQLGAAYSDSASRAPTVRVMLDLRQHSIDAYRHAIDINPNYAPAYDAMGLQLELKGEPGADVAYRKSIQIADSAAAHLDLGMWYIHGRNDYYDDRDLQIDELRLAEEQFRLATAATPTYWDAHAALGYVMYEQQRYDDAIGDLEAALKSEMYDRRLRRFLGRNFVKLCRLEDARTVFRSAYRELAKSDNESDRKVATGILADWGKVLDQFGLHVAALEQESQFLSTNLTSVDAAEYRGEIQVADANRAKIAAGLADLKAAVSADESKLDVVMAAYLAALIQAGEAAEALYIYKKWGEENLVPPPAPDTTLDAKIQPPKERARLSYARALLDNRQWDAALREFDVLHYLNLSPAQLDMRDLRAQAVAAGVSAQTLARIDAMGVKPARPASSDSETHECEFADIPRDAHLDKVSIDRPTT